VSRIPHQGLDATLLGRARVTARGVSNRTRSAGAATLHGKTFSGETPPDFSRMFTAW